MSLLLFTTILIHGFFFSTRMGEHHLSAGSNDKRMYWLSQLQRARREFSQAGAAAVAKNAASCKVRSHFIQSTSPNWILPNQTLQICTDMKMNARNHTADRYPPRTYNLLTSLVPSVSVRLEATVCCNLPQKNVLVKNSPIFNYFLSGYLLIFWWTQSNFYFPGGSVEVRVTGVSHQRLEPF